jgi:hypothetical protein
VPSLLCLGALSYPYLKTCSKTYDIRVPAHRALQQVFLSGRARSKRLDKDPENLALREVVTNTLIKQIRHPAVWEILVQLLHHFNDTNEEQWKRLSRTVIDALLPLMSST